MDDLLDRLEDRVQRAVDQLRELAAERVRLGKEVRDLNDRLRDLELRSAAGIRVETAAVADRPAVVGALREALAALRGG